MIPDKPNPLSLRDILFPPKPENSTQKDLQYAMQLYSLNQLRNNVLERADKMLFKPAPTAQEKLAHLQLIQLSRQLDVDPNDIGKDEKKRNSFLAAAQFASKIDKGVGSSTVGFLKNILVSSNSNLSKSAASATMSPKFLSNLLK